MKIYYKVVRDYNNKITSARSAKDDERTCINYKLNEWVKPKIPATKIFIFQRLLDAKNFKFYYEEIYKCHAKGVSHIGNYIGKGSIYEFCIRYSNAVLKHKKRPINNYLHYPLPNGTLFATEVKLLERVILC